MYIIWKYRESSKSHSHLVIFARSHLSSLFINQTNCLQIKFQPRHQRCMLIFSANVEQVKKIGQIKHIDIVLKSAAASLHMKGNQNLGKRWTDLKLVWTSKSSAGSGLARMNLPVHRIPEQLQADKSFWLFHLRDWRIVGQRVTGFLKLKNCVFVLLPNR